MTTSQNKKVSVVIPNYNYARYIRKRIWSVVRQTYPIHELIVLDDASTDGSVKIIEKELVRVRQKHPDLKVQFVKSEQNSGKAMAAWKKGFELATGDFVWIAEADDLCSRKFLVEAMRGFNDPDVVLSYTESRIINSWGMMVAPDFRWSRDREKTGHYNSSYIKDGTREIKEIMAVRCTIPNVSGVVFRREKKFLKYLDEALRFSQAGDWYFYAKILEDGKISYNRKALNHFRVHGGSKTGRTKNDKKHLQEIRKMQDYFRKKYDLDGEVLVRMGNEERRVAERMGEK